MIKTILFMGDSITDCCRKNEWGSNIGFGYATMVAGELGLAEPYCYRFINRGVSGNRIVDIYARAKKDMINLKPDYMSILVGVNDVWHEFSQGNGVDSDEFELVYGMLIKKLKATLPELKIMILEPFTLPGDATDPPDKPDQYELFRKEVELRAAVSKRIAEKYGLIYVPLQNKFDEANENGMHRGYWLWDGVHPTAAGHELIKNAWLKAFEQLK